MTDRIWASRITPIVIRFGDDLGCIDDRTQVALSGRRNGQIRVAKSNVGAPRPFDVGGDRNDVKRLRIRSQGLFCRDDNRWADERWSAPNRDSEIDPNEVTRPHAPPPHSCWTPKPGPRR
jgi:hypothetical protein